MITFSELAADARLAPRAGQRIAYGDHPLAFGDLWLPSRRDVRHPIVVLIHGGCWQATYGVDHVAGTAAALAASGCAVWAPEYRRLGDAGGGWPGTFDDVRRAIDAVRSLARIHPSLDPDRVVLAGHSAGGQLALWAAKRSGAIGVLSLAGISDLASYGAEVGECNAAVHPLLGGTPAEVPERYREYSPMESLPLRVPVGLVHGSADSIVPPAMSERFAARARDAGDEAHVVIVPGAGHFDVMSPRADAWPLVAAALRDLLTAT